jgi:acetyl-CoA acetyltransferase
MRPTSAAIAGIGVTETGKVFDRTPTGFASDAVRLAVADSGLRMNEIDGLLVSNGTSGGVDLSLAAALGLTELTVLRQVNAYGATAGLMIAEASVAVQSGAAAAVACVFADAPLTPGGGPSGEAYRRSSMQARGFRRVETAAGFTSVTHRYALAASRYMSHYGVTQDHLGAVAVSQRQWATDNPAARFRTPITLEDYHSSRWIVEPLHLLDCCLVSNGGAAVVVTSQDRAANSDHPPVFVRGWGEAHVAYRHNRGSEFGLITPAARSGPAALKMAGITVAQVDVREIYDCYTYTVLITLEDYGFCGKGEAGELAASGALAPGGCSPTNTGGGQLSSYYLWGMTPLIEAVTQVRGTAGNRQINPHNVAIVSGNGGVLAHHSTLVLASEPN